MKRKVHNVVLKFITTIAMITFLLGMAVIDTNYTASVVMVIPSALWLISFALANQEGVEEDADR